MIVILVVIYNVVIVVFAPEIRLFQNQAIKNHAAAERFIYSGKTYATIIVGTSLSARLNEPGGDTFSRNGIYNLAFNGGSALTGLEVIKRSGTLPKEIFIETNHAENRLDRELVERLFTPFVWKAKEYVPSLRYTYQPMNVFLTLLKGRFGKSQNEKENERPNQKRFEMGLKRKLHDMKDISSLEHAKNFNQMRELVDFFMQRGVRVVFFQMPVHPDIMCSEKYLLRRKQISDVFNDTEILWLDPIVADDYMTSDGEHLLYSSADRFLSVLESCFLGYSRLGEE